MRPIVGFGPDHAAGHRQQYSPPPARARVSRAVRPDHGVKQVLQFAQRMFNKERGLFMHGWVQGMEVHPEFY
jgi:hypothetical protein